VSGCIAVTGFIIVYTVYTVKRVVKWLLTYLLRFLSNLKKSLEKTVLVNRNFSRTTLGTT
jgi:hypothetical protein